MEKLPMCRICLVQNVRMYLVVNRNFHELYEKLTDIPFVTEDRRPILACFFCFAKLKQCWRFLRKCLEAEELFAQMINEDYEPKPLINQDHSEYLGGFIKSPTENISIVDVVQTESIAIKEKLPAVCEGPDDIIEPKDEHQCDGLLTELEVENLDNSCLDVAEIPPHYSESYLEYEVPLMEFKTEVKVEQEVTESYLEYEVPLMEFKTEVDERREVSMKKRRAGEMKSATVPKKPKLDARRTKLEDAITAGQMKKEKSDLKVIHTTHQLTSKPGTSKEPYKCDQRSINRVKKNTQQTRTQIDKKTYKCDLCLGSFSFRSNLIKHIRIHSGEKPYKCNVCLRSFTEKAVLTKHIRIHTGEKPFKCDVCQRSFSHKTSLTNHSRIHSGEKPYKCDICLRSFNQKPHLTEHTRIHTGEKRHKCVVCPRGFNRKSDLTKHIRIHTGEKPFMCDVCHQSFSQKIDLTKHHRVHTDEYKCDICQRSFSEKIDLTKHGLIHTGENKCDVCQRCFSEKSHLLQHIRIHTGVKPYKCDVCQQSFCQKSNLKRHIRVHTREKPYKCDVCERSFSQKGDLTRHVIRFHTGEKLNKS